LSGWAADRLGRRPRRGGLEQPYALLNDALATAPGIVERAGEVRSAGKGYGPPTGGIDCTGPFALAKRVPGQSIRSSPARPVSSRARCIAYETVQDEAAGCRCSRR